MPIRREAYITRQMLRDEPSTLWVFSDNLIGRGFIGQAYEMRGEPNAVGIPTKRLPAMDPVAYFDDADMGVFLATAAEPLHRLLIHLRAGGSVVWPTAGVGTGWADLELRAPQIWASLERARERLEAIA